MLRINKYIILSAIILFASNSYCFAQNGTLYIDIPLHPELIKLEEDITIDIDISGKCGIDSVKYENSLHMRGGKTNTEIRNLNDGVYQVSGMIFLHRIKGKYAEHLSLGSFGFPDAIIKNSAAIHLKKQAPEDCIYYKDFYKNICPVCKSNKNVVDICRGLSNIDPETGEDPQAGCYYSDKYSSCMQPSCIPLWYCKKDKVEF